MIRQDFTNPSVTLWNRWKKVASFAYSHFNTGIWRKPYKAIPAATAIEIFHNFTLLHDDIIDQAPLRRGRETVYKKWNVNTAILSGDTMFAIAFGELAKSDPEKLPGLMKVFTKQPLKSVKDNSMTLILKNHLMSASKDTSI